MFRLILKRLLLLIPVLLLSLWAQFQVSGSFRRYNAVNNRRRITGAQAAEAVLRAHGVFGVPVRPCRGNLTDHYDPRDNTIYLSETVYDAPTIAAVGVAAHEAGHAVQYAENYGPVRLRTAIIPATRIGSSLSFILLLVGLVLYNQSLFFIGTDIFITFRYILHMHCNKVLLLFRHLHQLLRIAKSFYRYLS